MGGSIEHSTPNSITLISEGTVKDLILLLRFCYRNTLTIPAQKN
jgi:hypothetical protein